MDQKDKVSLGVGVVALGTLGVFLVVKYKQRKNESEAPTEAAAVFSVGSEGVLPVEAESELPESEDDNATEDD